VQQPDSVDLLPVALMHLRVFRETSLHAGLLRAAGCSRATCCDLDSAAHHFQAVHVQGHCLCPSCRADAVI